MNCDTWPVPDGECANGCTIPEGTDAELVASASEQAGQILRILSGNQIGVCEDVLRPLTECAVCGPSCCCAGAGDRLRLYSAAGPITSVSEVKVDGVALADDVWRFYPSSKLLYAVPPLTWPRKDRKWADCDAVDTMCVTANIGYEPDVWALAVHAELTCELVKSCTGVGKCRLPANATQATSQGISVTLSPTELKQFLPSVAGWVAAVNPDEVQSPPMVFSPDLHRTGGSGCGC